MKRLLLRPLLASPSCGVVGFRKECQIFNNFLFFPDLFLFLFRRKTKQLIITRLGPLPLDVDATLAQISDVGEGGRAQIERAVRATGALVLNLINV